MNKIIYFSTSFIAIIVLLICASCSNDISDVIEDSTETQWKSCELVFQTSMQSRLASQSPSLKTGDALAIRFSKGSKYIIGYAIYDEVTNTWNARYKGNLDICDKSTCEVVYLGNQPTLNDNLNTISLTAQDAIFSCNDGMYSYDGKRIDLFATLSSNMARVSFVGTNASSFQIKGVEYCKSFDFGLWKITKSEPSEDAINVSIKNIEGIYKSEYIYIASPLALSHSDSGYSSESCIWVKMDDIVYVYNKNLDNLIVPLKSGIIQVPSQDDHDGWNMDTFNQMTFPDISVKSKSESTDGWSQILDSYKFNSKTGLHITFDNILTTGWFDDWIEEEFLWDYDSDGSHSDVWAYMENGMSYITADDNLVKNKSYHCSVLVYESDATYYYTKFFTSRLSYKVTNITVSNF